MARLAICPSCREPVRRIRADGRAVFIEPVPLPPGTLWPDDQSHLYSHTIIGWVRGVVEHDPVHAEHECPNLTDRHHLAQEHL